MKIYNAAEHTGKISLSKGNQIKINVGNLWFKADFMGYEGAAELATSDILAQSNVDAFFPYVKYQYSPVELNDVKYNGCVSENFIKDSRLITLNSVISSCTKQRADLFYKNKSTKEKISDTADLVQKNTGLKEFGKYLTVLFELDAFIYNEDRHLNNIALLERKDGTYDYCPIFDNGLAFLSNLQDYPLIGNNPVLRNKVKAKPFNVDFNKQKLAAEELYGSFLKFNKDVQLTETTKNVILDNYGDKILNRITNTIDVSKNKYKDMLIDEQLDYDDI